MPTHDADDWSDALEDRNMVAHTYRPDWTRRLADRVGADCLPILGRLAEALDRAATENV